MARLVAAGRGAVRVLFNRRRPAERIVLIPPVVTMVLAATAVPVEFRPPDSATLELTVSSWVDLVENIAGYVPVGAVLEGLGPLGAVFTAALMSTFAETSQFVMMHRDPSAVDVAANVTGALLGAAISSRWKIRSPSLRINKWTAVAAAVMAALLATWIWATSGVM